MVLFRDFVVAESRSPATQKHKVFLAGREITKQAKKKRITANMPIKGSVAKSREEQSGRGIKRDSEFTNELSPFLLIKTTLGVECYLAKTDYFSLFYSIYTCMNVIDDEKWLIFQLRQSYPALLLLL